MSTITRRIPLEASDDEVTALNAEDLNIEVLEDRLLLSGPRSSLLDCWTNACTRNLTCPSLICSSLD